MAKTRWEEVEEEEGKETRTDLGEEERRKKMRETWVGARRTLGENHRAGGRLGENNSTTVVEKVSDCSINSHHYLILFFNKFIIGPNITLTSWIVLFSFSRERTFG